MCLRALIILGAPLLAAAATLSTEDPAVRGSREARPAQGRLKAAATAAHGSVAEVAASAGASRLMRVEQKGAAAAGEMGSSYLDNDEAAGNCPLTVEYQEYFEGCIRPGDGAGVLDGVGTTEMCICKTKCQELNQDVQAGEANICAGFSYIEKLDDGTAVHKCYFASGKEDIALEIPCNASGKWRAYALVNTHAPTPAPPVPSASPTKSPTPNPTPMPTVSPSIVPTFEPTKSPTIAPSMGEEDVEWCDCTCYGELTKIVPSSFEGNPVCQCVGDAWTICANNATDHWISDNIMGCCAIDYKGWPATQDVPTKAPTPPVPPPTASPTPPTPAPTPKPTPVPPTESPTVATPKPSATPTIAPTEKYSFVNPEPYGYDPKARQEQAESQR
eukprot:TRINITY_DN65041_c0_g1_i1.p1 TRINITY_DN65041_c0_g1~~TRINITY_DN65041_c0_g1_i1.p1  ORF type:complete len:388 (-),score=89.39 TRINITY_DN65041_c0_g1_i1:95-1258(-)